MGPDVSDLAISELEDRHTCEAARALSLAMVSCPIHLAVFQGEDAEALDVQERMFDRLLRHYAGLVYVARLDRQVVGVLRMRACQGREASEPQAGEKDIQDTAARVAHWQAVWAQHDPKQPHWHLGPVGVLPAFQGSGVGTVLMQRFCHEVDARGGAAYLETDQSKNVRFYRKFGFQVIDEADIFDVKNYFMWRSKKS
jgi:ribosomal protein S18 acetylase RimI-like enzyme